MKKHFDAKTFMKTNSPTILTVVGSIGVIATAIMSGRDTLKARNCIKYQEKHESQELDVKEKIKLAAPCYIPTIIAGVSTILCICGANKLNKNMQKSLASAYVLLDRSYKEYRNAAKELYGEDGEKNIIKNVSSKHAEDLNLDSNDTEDVFFDFYSLQFFKSNLSKIAEAERTANHILRTRGYISLDEVYELLGEPKIKTCCLLGWSLGKDKSYEENKVEIIATLMPRDDGTRYYVIDFGNMPTDDYYETFM